MKSVKNRYKKGAERQETALCCPVNYDQKYLKIIPDEVIEKDYGCGDPSRYVKEGETVLDLGSGGGKICFITSQIVGPKGKVIGIDMTDEMLDLARRNLPIIEEKLGYKNIEFRHGQIQDLKTDLDLVDEYLTKKSLNNCADYKKFMDELETQKHLNPLVKDDSIDIIVSNCVLNLVHDEQKKNLFEEMFRVLKKGGRIAISDIVSDEESPKHLKKDHKLWSGCISGALQEAEFIHFLEEVGFYGIKIDKYESEPWQMVEGIEYRSVTITAFKGKEGPCIEKNQAVIYRGPWKEIKDDDEHTYKRGERTAVCDKTYNILTKEPYQKEMIPVPPYKEVKKEILYDCIRSQKRDPKETKQGVKPITTDPKQGCGDGKKCC